MHTESIEELQVQYQKTSPLESYDSAPLFFIIQIQQLCNYLDNENILRDISFVMNYEVL